MSRAVDVVRSWAASAATLGGGMYVGPLGPRPEQPLELYDKESCPFCRRVREAASVLDLEMIVYPCPSGGERFRPTLRELGGKTQLPFLVDANTGTQMFESRDIVRYLFGRYGAGSPPLHMMGAGSFAPIGTLASGLRLGKGNRARPSRAPQQPLDLWSFEASPYCRIVREALTELELPYHLHNVAKGSPSRGAFIERSGRMMVPYLADPNTGEEMFESADIVAYLHATYGA